MGNQYSKKSQIPKHLKPIKPKKKPATTSTSSNNENTKLKPILNTPVSFDNLDDHELAEDETCLVGSGPRGAFRWFKGRRYLNYASQKGLDNSLLPNDQIELDRQRVLAFIIRWAFKGDVIAPMEEEMKAGIKVLNVGFGPGMWTGHHIIDMAMDHPNSHFTAVDVSDLLPEDFEETAISNENVLPTWASKQKPPTSKNTRVTFTPMHPNLSKRFQNTTTPVTESSTLDSSILSQIDEVSSMDFSQSGISSCHTDIQSYHDNVDGYTMDPKNHVIPHRKLLANLDFFGVNVIDVGLPFPDDSFDFVMQRLVTASFTTSDWKRVVQELVRVTKPGGYIQLLEIDYNTFNLGPQGRQWETTLIETARQKRHMEPRIARNLADVLKAVGMIDVSSNFVSIPFGSWGLDLGNLWKHNMEMFVDSTCPLLSKLAGVTAKEYRAQWYGMFEEVKGQKPFSNIHAAWGRKSLQNSTIDWSQCPPLSPISTNL